MTQDEDVHEKCSFLPAVRCTLKHQNMFFICLNANFCIGENTEEQGTFVVFLDSVVFQIAKIRFSFWPREFSVHTAKILRLK